jgi:CCR4-NOT transcription complex subunit 4
MAKKPLVASVPEAKKNIKALAVESGLSKEIAKTKSQKALQDEEFPALGTPKVSQSSVAPAVTPKPGGGKPGSSGKRVVEKEKPAPLPAAASMPKAETRAAEKRPTPGILNIAAATKAAAQTKSVVSPSAADKMSANKDSAFPALPTPTTASMSSPVTRAAPKTLRVVPTPKSEMPPTPSGITAPVLAAASVRSAANVAIRPETPVSELISDSASIISASISASRTNSPPPTKVGSAPVRTTTKSQQRKQRKDAMKKDTVTIAAPIVKEEPEVEIAPIVGRKKKQKKEKEKAMSQNATPVPSRPETPVPQVAPPPPAREAREAKEETSTYRSTANETTTLTEEPSVHSARDTDLKGKGADGARSSDQQAPPKNLPTPAQILQDLLKAGVVSSNVDDLPFFHPMTWQTDKPRSDATSSGSGENTIKEFAAPAKSVVNESDLAHLLGGHPVRKTVDGIPVLLTPNGDCIRNLTRQEEDRFLQLQKSIGMMAGTTGEFVCTRNPASSTGFSLIKGRAVPNGPPTYHPPAPGQYPSDPITKIQREEAIYYINQYVLPRLNLSAKDLNFPNTKLDARWPPDARGGANAQAAASSLLAPWIYGPYGPNVPQHDGDAAAPELSYPGPIGSFEDNGPHPEMGTYLEVQATHAIQLPEEIIPGPLPGYKEGGNGHKAGQSAPQGSPFAGVPLMSYEDAEQALSLARKETDKLEKQLAQIMRKNRRLLTMSGGGH